MDNQESLNPSADSDCLWAELSAVPEMPQTAEFLKCLDELKKLIDRNNEADSSALKLYGVMSRRAAAGTLSVKQVNEWRFALRELALILTDISRVSARASKSLHEISGKVGTITSEES